MNDPISRRDALATFAAGAAAVALTGRTSAQPPAPATPGGQPAASTLTLPPLPYDPGALEPNVDALTMTIHHDRHHKAYVDNANAALAGTALAGKSADDILAALATAELPDNKRNAIRNNVGGHANHSLFWSLMAPPGKGGGGAPAGPLADALKANFESFDAKEGFKDRFAAAGMQRFGSGWAWLLVMPDKSLKIRSTANQDSPLMGEKLAGCSGVPILCLDVWEHAYYLKHQNKRADYISAWWNVVNWPRVGELFAAATR